MAPALRSFLPEQRLIQAGDFNALDLKYEAETAGFLSARLITLKGLGGGKDDGQGKNVDFQGMSLEIGAASPIEGEDSEANVALHHGSRDALLLHVDGQEGLQHLHRRLRRMGKYILEHEDALKTPYVMGVTYSELARVGMALGMRQLEIHKIDKDYRASVRALHALTFAKSKRPRTFSPAAVYLPTEEFVERFVKPLE